MAPTPTSDDRFSFGLWTVGWQAQDPFGAATRDPLDPVEAVHQPGRARRVGDHPPRRRPACRSARTTAARDGDPRAVPDARSTRPAWSCRCSRPTPSPTRSSRKAPSPPTTARCVGSALRKVLRNVDLAAELGARTFVMWGGREGSEYDALEGPQGRVRPLPRGHRHRRRLHQGTRLRPADRARAQAERAARRHPAADRRPRARLHRAARPRRHRRAQPRDRARADGRPELHPRHRAGAVGRQAVPHRPQRPARHQVRPGPGVRARRPGVGVLHGRPARERLPRRRPALRRAAPLRLQAVAHRGQRRRLGVGSRQHGDVPAAQGAGGGLPRRPRGAEALQAARVPELAAAHHRRGRDARGPCWPTAAPSRTSTSTRSPVARATSSGSTSSPCDHLLGAG